MAKIKVAFIKFGGMANGGTEKYLQTIAAHLPKDEFEVDFFYCDAAPYIGSDFKHLDTDESRVQYTESNGVNLIKFDVEYKDVTKPTHDWINTNFFEFHLCSVLWFYLHTYTHNYNLMKGHHEQ